jgi:hypothetical protein
MKEFLWTVEIVMSRPISKLLLKFGSKNLWTISQIFTLLDDAVLASSTVYTRQQIQTFRRHMLFPSSGSQFSPEEQQRPYSRENWKPHVLSLVAISAIINIRHIPNATISVDTWLSKQTLRLFHF